MGLSSLDAALSGLRISQQQINVISNNVANVSTPGYSRKILPQTAQSILGQTVGVSGETIIRQVDLNLQRDLWTQISGVGQLSIKQSYLQRVEQFHGPPDAQLSVAAELARLKDTFAALADSPEDTFRLASAVNQAVDMADKINGFSELITTLRNDAQGDMEATVTRINDLIEQIAEINVDIKGSANSGRTIAAQEDERDEAIKELSGLIEINFFKRGDGVMVVQTRQGVELASDLTSQLIFDPLPLSAETYYPLSARGITVLDPSRNPNTAIDITYNEVGGKLGGLIELRDEIFPQQMAQLDEMAHKLALRFEAQGLRLFTDATGNIPADTPPDPTTLPNPTPVEYVGFSAVIRVNADILADHTLLQQGTTGAFVQTGSNEVIRRIVEFTFGSVDFQQAIGTIDMRTSLQAAPNNTLQNWLGLYSENRVTGSVDLSAYASVADILIAGGVDAFGPPNTDRFTITFDDPDFGGGPYVIDIDLGAIAAGPGNAAQELVAAIMADADWANAVADFNATVAVGANGELVFNSRSDITIAAAGVDPLSDLGFAFLGLVPGTTQATDPYFDIKVGNNPATRITIDPNDDEDDLFAQLSAVPGLGVEDFTASADGFIRLRPGSDYLDPEFGGDITITGGPYRADSAGINGVIGPGTVPDTVSIVSALFGSFNAGAPPQDISPLTDVRYGSQTNGSLAPPIPTVPFRTSLLGPGANISTEIVGSSRILDFVQKIVNQQAQDLVTLDNRIADKTSLREVIQSQLLNQSGVNLDEELAHLIVVQTAYAASARVINAVDELFRELLDAIR